MPISGERRKRKRGAQTGLAGERQQSTEPINVGLLRTTLPLGENVLLDRVVGDAALRRKVRDLGELGRRRLRGGAAPRAVRR